MIHRTFRGGLGRPSAGRLAASLVLLLVALALVACGDDDDGEREAGGVATAPDQVLTVAGGTTTLDVDETTRAQLREDGIEVSAVAPATATDSGLELPISRGTFQPQTLVGAIDHGSAGIRFARSDGREAVYLDLVVSTGDGFLVAGTPPSTVVGELELTDLDSEVTEDGFTAREIPVAFEGAAANALRDLGADQVRPGTPLGTLTIRASATARP